LLQLVVWIAAANAELGKQAERIQELEARLAVAEAKPAPAGGAAGRERERQGTPAEHGRLASSRVAEKG
jgi:hypothetical protein